jgi:hypothetical protein
VEGSRAGGVTLAAVTGSEFACRSSTPVQTNIAARPTPIKNAAPTKAIMFVFAFDVRLICILFTGEFNFHLAHTNLKSNLFVQVA